MSLNITLSIAINIIYYLSRFSFLIIKAEIHLHLHLHFYPYWVITHIKERNSVWQPVNHPQVLVTSHTPVWPASHLVPLYPPNMYLWWAPLHRRHLHLRLVKCISPQPALKAMPCDRNPTPQIWPTQQILAVTVPCYLSVGSRERWIAKADSNRQ